MMNALWKNNRGTTSRELLASLWTYRFVTSFLIIAVVFAFKLNNPERVYGLTATGGIITTNGSAEVHTFASSGTFTVTGSGTVEVLVVAGGGGGGNNGS